MKSSSIFCLVYFIICSKRLVDDGMKGIVGTPETDREMEMRAGNVRGKHAKDTNGPVKLYRQAAFYGPNIDTSAISRPF